MWNLPSLSCYIVLVLLSPCGSYIFFSLICLSSGSQPPGPDFSVPSLFSQDHFPLSWARLYPSKRCWDLNPQCLWMWPYLKIGSFQMIKLGWEFGQTLIQYDCVLIRGQHSDTDMNKRKTMWIHKENIQAKECQRYQKPGERAVTFDTLISDF